MTLAYPSLEEGAVITLTSGKGGVGKTTTTANLSAALALMGYRVIMIDADIGLRNLDIVTGLEDRVLFDLLDLVEGRCDLDQVLVRDDRAAYLYLLPASQERGKDDITPEQMLAVCQTLRQRADFVFIDSPAGIEQGFKYAVTPADRVLVVTTPDVSAVRDADKVIYLLERDYGQQPALILNRYDIELVRRQDMMSIDDVLDILGIDLIGVVPDDQEVIVSNNQQYPIAFNPRQRTSQAYRNIALRILGQDVPLMRFDRPGVAALFRWMLGGS